jgi:hypothetical protein
VRHTGSEQLVLNRTNPAADVDERRTRDALGLEGVDQDPGRRDWPVGAVIPQLRGCLSRVAKLPKSFVVGRGRI